MKDTDEFLVYKLAKEVTELTKVVQKLIMKQAILELHVDYEDYCFLSNENKRILFKEIMSRKSDKFVESIKDLLDESTNDLSDRRKKMQDE